MNPKQLDSFGGDWTTEKLNHVEKYLRAYTTIMTRRPEGFIFAYIDAFAGTGYWQPKEMGACSEFQLPELADEENRRFVDGSARRALCVNPPFQKYIFVEKRGCAISSLERLREEFPGKAEDIIIENADANDYLQKLCGRYDWIKSNRRAVLFLDPFGMQVEWKTIEAIAGTRAIDMWLLFPVGAVLRTMPRDAEIPESWRRCLDKIFGDERWYEVSYRVDSQLSFSGEAGVKRTATAESVGEYFKTRLKSIFASVAENPLTLYNSKGAPLYLLCFAAANPKGATTAVRIAQDILRR